MMRANEFIRFCVEQHDTVCNQKYAKEFPYSMHLELVEAQVDKFIHLLDDGEKPIARMGAWGHDLIEDARVSYNDISKLVGTDVAEVIFLCTENKGRNRAERKDGIFYNNLSKNRIAVFVKLCDIIANSMYSAMTGSDMFKKYKNEYSKINALLFNVEFAPMFEYLERIYQL